MEEHRKLGGRYSLLDPLGHGGMAVVWRARDEVLGRTVAVKVLAARHAGDPESRARIRHEARAAAALSHPNIAQVYDYGEQPTGGTTTPYVVMELVRGGTLQQRMAGPVPPKFAMRVCAEVAAALAAAHADGLVHRDIKPANVMLTEAGAKVVDFGIAAAINPSGSGDPDAEIYGTPAYLAPERLVDDAVDPASDVYALGVLLYRLLSGHSPWTADTTTQMLTAHIYIEPEPLAPLPEVPAYITELCNRCLTKDVTLRPSAREAAALLAQAAGLRVVADEPSPAPAGHAADPTPSVLIRREEAVAAAAVLPTTPAAAAPPAPPTPATAVPAAPPTPAAATRTSLPPGDVPPDDVSAAPGARNGRPSRRPWLVAVLAVLIALGAVAWAVLPREHRTEPPAGAQPAAAPSRATPSARTTTNASVETSAGAPTSAPADDEPGGRAASTTAPAAPPAAGHPAPATTTPRPRATTTTPANPPEPTATAPQQWSFSSYAGTVRATCTGPDQAELLSWEATKPYKVQDNAAGPAASPWVLFKKGNDRLRMTVTCAGGVASSSSDEV
ncbi:serine/threonine-protein kinase [Actinoplanes sp. NPDC049548]|uniref:serine/threonine-protein kinase n=1 Tax=Actinoplanes sp. NPDC049548 TaxID=3155152 RepID=UPI0034495BAD